LFWYTPRDETFEHYRCGSSHGIEIGSTLLTNGDEHENEDEHEHEDAHRNEDNQHRGQGQGQDQQQYPCINKVRRYITAPVMGS